MATFSTSLLHQTAFLVDKHGIKKVAEVYVECECDAQQTLNTLGKPRAVLKAPDVPDVESSACSEFGLREATRPVELATLANCRHERTGAVRWIGHMELTGVGSHQVLFTSFRYEMAGMACQPPETAG